MTAARLGRLRERLRASSWPLPTLCCVIALALGLLLTRSDQQIADNVPFLFPGGPDGARRDDWRQAEQILGEEAERASSSPAPGRRWRR